MTRAELLRVLQLLLESGSLLKLPVQFRAALREALALLTPADAAEIEAARTRLSRHDGRERTPVCQCRWCEHGLTLDRALDALAHKPELEAEIERQTVTIAALGKQLAECEALSETRRAVGEAAVKRLGVLAADAAPPKLRECDACHGPGPALYDQASQRYCCVRCHSMPSDPFFAARGI